VTIIITYFGDGGLKLRVKAFFGRLATPLMLRYGLGRWLGAEGRALYHQGVSKSGVNLPPMLRGLLALPDGRAIVRQAASFAWHQEHGTLDPGGPPDLGGDLFTAWTGPAVAFLHMEKSGGSAVMHWVSKKFHPLQINPDARRELPAHLFTRAAGGLPDDTPRYPLVWGHYDLPSLQRLAPGRFTFTILREPCARLLSLYHFWRSVDPEKVDLDISFSVAQAHRLSLEDFLKCDDPMLTDLTDNLYTRRLTGLYATGAGSDPLYGAPVAAQEQAARAMGRLAFVGISERMEASLRGLAAHLGVAAPAQNPRANVTDENFKDTGGWYRKSPPVQRSAAAEELLLRRTMLDRALYAKALDGFDRPKPEAVLRRIA
jgi:hypothetical protein